LNLKEHNRIKALNQVETKVLTIKKAREILRVTESQVWRMLAQIMPYFHKV
jgi:hypothetical protein